MIAAPLLVALSAAPSAGVALLPLLPGDGVTEKQTRGIDLLARKAIATTGFLELSKGRRDDPKVRKRCLSSGGVVDVECMSDAAYQRGVALVAIGVLSRGEEGFDLKLQVVERNGDVILRTLTAPLAGDHLAADLDRAMRRIFTPQSIAGGLYVTGPPGARILVGDKLAGQLPMDAVEGLVEGEHRVRAELDGYFSQVHTVKVHYREMTTLELVMIRERGSAGEGEQVESISQLLLGGGAVASAGGVLVAAGAVSGLLSFVAKREVESRAEAQLLTFPRDAKLLRRGELLAWGANGLYAVGLLTSAAGGVLAGLAFLPDDSDGPERLTGPAEGAPEADDLVPALEGL